MKIRGVNHADIRESHVLEVLYSRVFTRTTSKLTKGEQEEGDEEGFRRENILADAVGEHGDVCAFLVPS